MAPKIDALSLLVPKEKAVLYWEKDLFEKIKKK